MPSSRHAGRISSSTSRAHSEYSVCSAVMGWIFEARAQRLRSRLGQAEVAHLARFHQPRHRAHRVLDRHVRVDAVQVVEVDGVDAELRAGSRRSAARTYSGVPL